MTALTVPHSSIADRANRVLANTYARPSSAFVDGRGARLIAKGGRSFLDFTSGIAVTALGHAHPAIVDIMKANADGLVHTSNLFHTTPPVELAEKLVEHSFADRVFFCNSGAEAVEGAIKFARLAAGEGRRRVIYFAGAFHGRTYGALAATDKEAARKPFEPLPQQYERLDWDDPEALRSIDESTAAVIIEPIQGEGGVRVIPEGFLGALRSRCDEVGAALIFDEIQTGLGRTGTLWAHEPSQVLPDLMTVAKPLAGGLPMGAVLMREAIASHLAPGCHGTTFGGGPFVAAVALEVLRIVTSPGFLKEVEHKGALLEQLLAAIDDPRIVELRGRGLMRGIKVSVDLAELTRRCHDRGLLVVGAGEGVLRFLPPLTVTPAELEEATRSFAQALEDCA